MGSVWEANKPSEDAFIVCSSTEVQTKCKDLTIYLYYFVFYCHALYVAEIIICF